VAERLGRGLQNPVQRFNSAPGLHFDNIKRKAKMGEW